MYPQEIRPVLETTGTLPDYMEPIGVGMPVDLLLRRPDVRSAERSVNAQAALLGASKSDWLPKIFLKGSFGYAARDLNDLVKSKSMTYEIAPPLRGHWGMQQDWLRHSWMNLSINLIRQF